MTITITTSGYIEVYRDGEFISRHTVETKAVESAITHAEEHGDGDYEIRFPNKVLMSRIRRIVMPFKWNTVTAVFTQGTAGTVNLSSFLDNPQGRGIIYTVIGTLPTGVTLSGSTVSYNGTSPASLASVQFRATSGSYAAESSPVAVTIQAVTVTNRAPTWSTTVGPFTVPSTGGTVALSSFASDLDGDPLTFGRTGGVLDTAPGGVSVNSAGVMTVSSGLTAGAYSVEVYADDGAIGFAPNAGYAVSGDISDGGTLTITGSGFGTMGGDVIQFGRGDEGADGAPIHGSTPTAGSAYETFLIGLGADPTGQHLLYSGANPRTGRTRSLRRRAEAGGSGVARNGGFGYPTNNKTQLYISYYRYAQATSWSQATANHKQYYVFSNGVNGGGLGETPQPILVVPAGQPTWALGTNNGYGSDINFYCATPTPGWTLADGLNAWQRWESWLVLGTPASMATDGQIAVWRDGVLGINDTSVNWQGNMITPATAFSYLRLGHMDTNMAGFVADFSDYYVADTRARVEIGNASTWAACTQKEIQLARNANWSDGSIAATVNTGAFSSLAGKYLYVVKSDGSAVRIGQFT